MLLLSKWNPAFAWLPVESIIHENQQAYYFAINASNAASESTEFIEFMLSAIKASLIEAINMSDDVSDGSDKSTLRWKKDGRAPESAHVYNNYRCSPTMRRFFDYG